MATGRRGRAWGERCRSWRNGSAATGADRAPNVRSCAYNQREVVRRRVHPGGGFVVRFARRACGSARCRAVSQGPRRHQQGGGALPTFEQHPQGHLRAGGQGASRGAERRVGTTARHHQAGAVLRGCAAPSWQRRVQGVRPRALQPPPRRRPVPLGGQGLGHRRVPLHPEVHARGGRRSRRLRVEAVGPQRHRHNGHRGQRHDRQRRSGPRPLGDRQPVARRDRGDARRLPHRGARATAW